jgi:hypothetical protein
MGADGNCSTLGMLSKLSKQTIRHVLGIRSVPRDESSAGPLGHSVEINRYHVSMGVTKSRYRGVKAELEQTRQLHTEEQQTAGLYEDPEYTRKRAHSADMETPRRVQRLSQPDVIVDLLAYSFTDSEKVEFEYLQTLRGDRRSQAANIYGGHMSDVQVGNDCTVATDQKSIRLEADSTGVIIEFDDTKAFKLEQGEREIHFGIGNATEYTDSQPTKSGHAIYLYCSDSTNQPYNLTGMIVRPPITGAKDPDAFASLAVVTTYPEPQIIGATAKIDSHKHHYGADLKGAIQRALDRYKGKQFQGTEGG